MDASLWFRIGKSISLWFNLWYNAEKTSCKLKRSVTAMEKRRQAIVDLVNQAGELSIAQLHEAFPSVSEVTLRKDVRCLDEEKRLVRVFGGAKSIQDLSNVAANFSARNLLHQEEKLLIGSKAAALIPAGASVYLSAGTTCSAVARQLPRQPMNIFTDGLNIALDLPTYPEVHMELLGGTIDRRLMRLVGAEVMGALSQLYFDYAFIGALGFHPECGFSCSSPMIAATLKKAMERSDKVVILMDSSKVNNVRTPRSIDMDAVDIVVSDGKLPLEVVERMESHGITVL